MSHFPEVITLLSSDEESPSTEDVTPISVKNEIPIKLKESARKSINTRKELEALKSSGSNKPNTSKSKSCQRSNISSITNSIPNLSNKNSPATKAFDKKVPQTARKSMHSSQPSQNILLNNNNGINIPSKQAESKGRLISQKSCTNYKDTTTSLNNKEIPFADKLKERGISISSNAKSDKNSSSVSNVKNDYKNIGKLVKSIHVSSKLNNSNVLNGENKESLLCNIISNKNLQPFKIIPTKLDKDVLLGSKKRKLTTNDESKLGSQSIPEISMHKSMATNNDSRLGSKLKCDLPIEILPTNIGSNIESQSKHEQCVSNELNAKNGVKFVSESKHALTMMKPISTDLNAHSKAASLSVNLNSESKSNESDKKLTSPDKEVIYSDVSLSEKINSFNGSSSINCKILNAKNKTVSGVISNSANCASSTSFQDEGDLDVINLLTSEPIPVSEKVQQYLNSNSAITETIEKQPKEVTSPKLSLKRKREENSEILSTTKKGLFLNEIKKESPEKKTEDTATKYSIPSHNEDTISSVKSATAHPALRDLHAPGPSHETCSVESNKQKFEMLIDFCMKSSVLNWEEKSKVRSNIFKSLHRASEHFVSSLDFSNLIDTMFASIRERPNKIMTFLNDLRGQLREKRSSSAHKHHQTEIQSPLHNEKAKDLSPVSSRNEDSVVSKQDFKKKETTLKMSSPSLSSKKTEQSFKIDSNMKSGKSLPLSVNANLSTVEAQMKLDKKIEKLEKHLGKLHKRVKELQAKELSLDDLDNEDSNYILEDRYKRKILRIHEVLCKLKNESTRLHFEMERRYSFNGTRYQEINRAVEKFINKRKKVDKFPSYIDILNLVKTVNESVILGIKESEYSSLARDIFEEVGNELKRRRRKDEEKHFGCYLTDDVKLEDDPAEKDEELKLKLTNSVIQGEQKLKELIEKYAAQQEAVGSDQEEANADDGSEQEEANADDGSEQKEASADDGSEQKEASAESDVSIEPPYIEDDDNLPSTNPATPATGVPDEPASPINRIQREEINVVTVGSDSDASTDPGFHIKNNNFNTVSTNAVDSESSCDLPPIILP